MSGITTVLHIDYCLFVNGLNLLEDYILHGKQDGETIEHF
jgi:hypothetical protein